MSKLKIPVVRDLGSSHMAALVVRFVPEMLSFADAKWRDLLAVNWAYVLAAGIALGVLNGYLTFARKPSSTE